MADSSKSAPDGTNDDASKVLQAQETTGKDVKAAEDPELDDLLDSALEDFYQPVLSPQPVHMPTAKKPETRKTDPVASAVSGSGPAEEWTDEFIQQATAQFEDAMKNFIAEDQSLGEEFRKMAEATQRAMSSQESEQSLGESLAQTLKGLAENAEAISNPLTDEEISQLLGNIGLSQDIGTIDGSEPEDLLHIMKNVMQNLLSKELLYPALKEIVEKYPNWLTTNRPSLDESEYEKYSKQYEIMKKACDEFEAEKEDDPEDVKKARFEKVLDHMQKMQEFGHPPKELIGDMAPGFVELDEQGNPRISGLPLPSNGSDPCSLM